MDPKQPRHAKRPQGAAATRRGHRRRWAALGATVLIIAGAVIVVVGVEHTSPPGPAPLPAHPFSVAAVDPAELPASDAAGHVRTMGPNEVSIPSLNIEAPLVPEAIADHSLDIPGDVHEVGVWTGGATVDATSGTVLLAGHVNYADQGAGALYPLAGIQRHALIYLSDASGHVTTWTTTALQAYPKADLPQNIFAPTGPRSLVLVTCGGPFDTRTGHYLDNVVVTAAPLLQTRS